MVYLKPSVLDERKNMSQKKFHLIRNVFVVFAIGCVAGCGSLKSKPLLMSRDGLYRFPDDAKKQYLLYYTEDHKWKRTHKKVQPTTDMVIIYDSIVVE